jgi:ABC-2 type transport system permease protein
VTALLASEIAKLRTVRVPYVFIGIVILLAVGSAVIFVISESFEDEPDDWLMLAQGANFANILATILGILIVTNEYRHGTITSTFLVEPARERVLGAKLAAAVAVGVVFALVAFLVAIAVAVPWQAARGDALELDGSIVEALARLVASYVIACALGIGVGAIIQNQVGAIVATFVWFFVIESVIATVAALFSDGLGEPDPVSPYLPGSALQAIVGFEQADDFLFSAPAGALLASVYAALLVALGALSMLRRDP